MEIGRKSTNIGKSATAGIAALSNEVFSTLSLRKYMQAPLPIHITYRISIDVARSTARLPLLSSLCAKLEIEGLRGEFITWNKNKSMKGFQCCLFTEDGAENKDACSFRDEQRTKDPGFFFYLVALQAPRLMTIQPFFRTSDNEENFETREKYNKIDRKGRWNMNENKKKK